MNPPQIRSELRVDGAFIGLRGYTLYFMLRSAGNLSTTSINVSRVELSLATHHLIVNRP